MKYIAIISLLSIGFLMAWLPTNKKTAKYCGRAYIEKQFTEYLKEEKIYAQTVGVIDKKSNQVRFGYIVSAFRNDTNFIYSKFSYIADTIIIKEFHNYKISDGADSIIRKYLCTKKGLMSYTYERYWAGERVSIDSNKYFIVKY